MPQLDVFSLNLDQFADSGSGGSKEADHEIPEHFIILFQTRFEVFVVCFADYIFQKSFLLNTDKWKLPFVFADTLQVTVHGTKSEIYRLGLVILDQPYLVLTQLFLGDIIVLFSILLDGEHIRRNGVF